MSELNELYEKIKFELNEAKEESKVNGYEEDRNNESESDESEAAKEEKSRGGLLGVRQVTSRSVVGRVNKDFDWQIDYDILRKAICDEVITVDINKTKKLFKLFKDYINGSDKFESKYKAKK